MSFRDHADKVGVAGAAFAALCCLGVSVVLSLLTSIGAGFLINDAILAPLLIVFIAVTIWGLASGWRRHRNITPLVLGSAGGLALFVFSYVHQSRAIAYAEAKRTRPIAANGRTFANPDRLETDQCGDGRRKVHAKSVDCLSSKCPLNRFQQLHRSTRREAYAHC